LQELAIRVATSLLISQTALNLTTNGIAINVNYYFVAPKGCGTSFTKLLGDPAALSTEILARWEKDISNEIISGKKISLDDDLKRHIEAFDFSIFDRIQTKTVIEEHKQHPNHLTWFGGGLPDRSILEEDKIPAEIAAHENVYVNQLLLAYNSDTGNTYVAITDITEASDHHRHFKRARVNFHHAEQLRNFSRDNLPQGTFERFQDEIHDGVVNIAESDHSNGFIKVKAVETQSAAVAITSNPLKEVSTAKDRVGVCHQLCNDKKLRWIEK
jgi:hypothetical protein